MNQVRIKQGVDWSVVWLYIILVTIGLVSIFMVQYRETDDISTIILKGTKDYGKQFRWLAVCTVLAIFILLTDSKFFTATANLQYGVGILLILITFIFHSKVKGSNSFLGYGKVKLFQPAEFTKIFATLALAKFLSLTDTNFSLRKNHFIAIAIVLAPAIFTILQNETGLALVYFSLFLPMFREGLPSSYLIYTAIVGVVTVAAFLIKPLYLLLGIAGIMVLSILYILQAGRRLRKYISKIVISGIAIGMYSFLLLPFIYNNILPPHQKTRMCDLFGIEAPAFAIKSSIDEVANEKKNQKKGDSYNVRQSKIAIGSGGFIGKGFLNNTQTRFDFVPEQHTDFIFCSVAEAFGFVGSFILLAIYLTLLWRITIIAERQRSTFSRVYAYGTAAIIFFHIFINLAMTLGLAPVIGIPLPFVSYGGTSLITFTVLLFILIRLDADRQMVLR